MSVRMTEEEYADLMRRRLKATPPMRLQSATAKVEYYDEINSYNGVLQEKPEKKRQKYGNRRVEIDGMKFDSQHEADVYADLMLRVRAGELQAICRQVKFDLPGGIVYVADFVTIDKNMHAVVYDAKSEATKQNRVYINKKKQMKACLGIEIVEV